MAPLRGILVCSLALAFWPAACLAEEKVGVEIYLAAEVDACGPQGYQPPPKRCTRLVAKRFDDEVGANFILLRSGILIPPGSIKWHKRELGVIREYQNLGSLKLPRRKSAVIVFKWIQSSPKKISLERDSSSSSEPYEAEVGADKRTFFHLPLQYLNPSWHDRWLLTTDSGRYTIRFDQ